MHKRGESAEVLRDTSSLKYTGTAANFQRVYEFFHGYASSADQLGYSARFKAQLVRPLAPDAGELMDLHDRLVSGGVERINLEAEEAGSGNEQRDGGGG